MSVFNRGFGIKSPLPIAGAVVSHMKKILRKYNLYVKKEFEINSNKDFVSNYVLENVKLSSFDHISNIINISEKNEKQFVGKIEGNKFLLKKNIKALEFESNKTWIELNLKELEHKSTKITVELYGLNKLEFNFMVLGFGILIMGIIISYLYFELSILYVLLIFIIGILFSFMFHNLTKTDIDNTERIIDNFINKLKKTPYNTGYK